MSVRDLDAATRALYEQILSEPRHRELMRALERDDDAMPCKRHEAPASIVLVPGIFYADYPHTGADGAVLRDVARALRLPFATIPVDGTAGLDAAAATINTWLAGAAGTQPVVLFSLSKGSAEVRHALTLPGAELAFRNVIAWISISGLPFGTPSFEHHLAHPLRRALVTVLFKLKGWRLEPVRDLLRHRPGASFTLPTHLQFIQVAAFPRHADLCDRRSRRLHRALAVKGPNDGFALLEELAALPGQIYPLWGADHYLRRIEDLPFKIETLIEYVLHRAASQPGLESKPVAHETTIDLLHALPK